MPLLERTRFVTRMLRNPVAVAGTVFILVSVFVAIWAPWVSGTSDPNVNVGAALRPPSAHFLFGTDSLARDGLAQVVFGARVSLTVGLVAALMTVIVGTIVGALSGIYGGLIDVLGMRLAEMFQVLPPFILAAVIVAMLGPSLTNVILVIALLTWPQTARLSRNEVMRTKNLSYVDAARCLGYGSSRILVFEVIPNIFKPILSLGTLTVGGAVILEASLAYLGLGDPSTPSWGLMLRNGQQQIFNGWWLTVFPGAAIFLIVLAFNVVGDALGDRR